MRDMDMMAVVQLVSTCSPQQKSGGSTIGDPSPVERTEWIDEKERE